MELLTGPIPPSNTQQSSNGIIVITPAYMLCWYPAHNLIRRDVVGDYCSCSYHRTIPQSNSAHDYCIVPNPYVIPCNHFTAAPPLDDARIILPQTIVGCPIGQMMGCRSFPHGMIYRINAHSGSNGIEFSQFRKNYIVRSE